MKVLSREVKLAYAYTLPSVKSSCKGQRIQSMLILSNVKKLQLQLLYSFTRGFWIKPSSLLEGCLGYSNSFNKLSKSLQLEAMRKKGD